MGPIFLHIMGLDILGLDIVGIIPSVYQYIP